MLLGLYLCSQEESDSALSPVVEGDMLLRINAQDKTIYYSGIVITFFIFQVAPLVKTSVKNTLANYAGVDAKDATSVAWNFFMIKVGVLAKASDAGDR